jgi:hypothetical protein
MLECIFDDRVAIVSHEGGSQAMTDDTEVNAAQAERQTLEQRYGHVWDADELREQFVVLGFRAPFVVVERKADGRRGSLEFQAYPRYYFNFVADKP